MSQTKAQQPTLFEVDDRILQQQVKFVSIDDEEGEFCSVCGIPLTDRNRDGTEDFPLCSDHRIRAAFLTEFIRRGGTPEVKAAMMENTPVWLKRKLGV